MKSELRDSVHLEIMERCVNTSKDWEMKESIEVVSTPVQETAVIIHPQLQLTIHSWLWSLSCPA